MNCTSTNAFKMIHTTSILKIVKGIPSTLDDYLAVEEPLEIRLRFGKGLQRQERSLSVTMRTPGDDKVLVAGFLYTEGIIDDFKKVQTIRHCTNVAKPEEEGNVILVEISPEVAIDFDKLNRHFYTTSSCGVCGKSSIEAIVAQSCPILNQNQPIVPFSIIHDLPDILLKKQDLFDNTGGIHAAALFDSLGNVLLVKEDIGRHNAVDKVIGAALYQKLFPLDSYILLVSGRAGFELVQKSIKAGIPIMAAVGAPSSLAVSLAREFGLTLIGFLKKERLNIYAGKKRIAV